MNRAYATLQWRAVDEDQRIVEGVANTNDLDSYGTIIEPRGAVFSLPLPFLWQHFSDAPIGHVISATVTDDKITIRAQVERSDRPGLVKDRLDAAWDDLRLRLVRGLSIGFEPLEQKGNRFLKWAWRELSAVTLPAGVGTSITAVRSTAEAQLAAIGSTKPGVSGTRGNTNTPLNPRRTMTILEQITQHENSRAAKVARQTALMDAAGAEGATLDAAQAEEYDTLAGEVEAIDGHLTRLRALDKANRAAAVPVNGRTPEEAANSRGGGVPVVRSRVVTDPGIQFARVVRASYLAQRRGRDVEAVARELYADDHLVIRAAVAAHNTTNSSALVSDEGGVFADFVEFLRPQTIVGRFGTNGIPNLRRVPFRVPLITQTGGGSGYWVGEGAPKPLTGFSWTRTSLDELKVANIAVTTDELLRQSSPSADTLLRDSLAGALRERMDTDFINPAKAAVAGVSPASITNGLTAIVSSGTDAAAVRADVQALFGAFIAANNPPTAGVWIMPATTALALSLMTNALGQPEFPGITMTGGTFFGMPVLVSQYVPTAYDPDGAGAGVAGAVVVLANAEDIYFADEGGIAVDTSREASLQMDDAPTNNSVTPTATTLVSLFQTNSVAFRAERVLNWMRRRVSGVQMLVSVNWAP